MHYIERPSSSKRKKEAAGPKVVIFSVAFSILLAMQNPKNKEVDMLVSLLDTPQ